MDGVRRARTRGPRAGRGVRTRGGRASVAIGGGDVEAGRGRGRGRGRGLGMQCPRPVADDVVDTEATRGRGRGRGRGLGMQRPEPVDEMNIVHVGDWIHGSPSEVPLTSKRKRRWCPSSSASAGPTAAAAAAANILENPPSPGISSASAGPAAAAAATVAANIVENTPSPGISSSASAGPAAATAAAANIVENPPSPGIFIECREDGAFPIPPPAKRRSQGARPLREDEIDFLVNFGSESESESETDEVDLEDRRIFTRVERFLEETPQDEEGDTPVIDSDASRHTTGDESATAADVASGSSGPSFGPDFYDFVWRTFPDPPIEPEVRREKFSNSNVGPTTPCVDPYDTFIAIWDRQIMEHIVSETNEYAKEVAQNSAPHLKSRIKEWRDTTVNELYTYLAIILAMGCVIKSRLEEYWCSDQDIFATPFFSSYMSLRRFQMLSKCLHFNRNEGLRGLNLGSSEAKIYKIKPVLKHSNEKFQQMYNLQQNLALDESLLMWKGWLSINQHIRNKAAAIGIKTYEFAGNQRVNVANFTYFLRADF